MIAPDSASPWPSAMLGERRLHAVGHPVGKVGRRHRARCRMARNADDAVLAQMHARGGGRLPAFFGTVWSMLLNIAHHRRRPRAGFGEIEAARHAIRIVAQVDVDHRSFGIDGDLGLNRDAVCRRTGKMVVRAAMRAFARLELADRGDHPLLGVVEQRLLVLVQRVPADFGGQREHLAFADAGGTDHGEDSRPTTAPARGYASGTCGSMSSMFS